MGTALFFDFSIEAQGGYGFALFSPAHGVYLLLCAALTAGLCALYRRSGAKQRRRLRMSLAGAAVAVELLRALVLLLAGEYGLGRLPLHLCTIAVYLTLYHALQGGWLLGQFLYAFCLPGAAAAILLPDWRCYPPIHFMTLCGFSMHLLTVAYVLTQAAGGDLRPDIRALPRCLGLMLLLAAPVYVFDRLFGTNYMFLNWPPAGTPLGWFAPLGPGFVLGYLPLAALVWAVMYTPFFRLRRKKARTE